MNKSEEQLVNELKYRGNALEKECKLLKKKIRDLKGYLNVLEKTLLTEEEINIVNNIQIYLKGAEND